MVDGLVVAFAVFFLTDVESNPIAVPFVDSGSKGGADCVVGLLWCRGAALPASGGDWEGVGGALLVEGDGGSFVVEVFDASCSDEGGYSESGVACVEGVVVHGVEGSFYVKGYDQSLTFYPPGGFAHRFDNKVGDIIGGVPDFEAIGTHALEEVGEFSGYDVPSPYAVVPLSVSVDAGDPS